MKRTALSVVFLAVVFGLVAFVFITAERIEPYPGASMENALHRRVCNFGYPLKEAQRRGAENWFDVEMALEGGN